MIHCIRGNQGDETVRVLSPRNGFTLLEILLVMAILVIMAAVTAPTLESMYGDTRVRGAGDDVRRAWAEARSRAINSGTPQRFAVKFGTEQFRVAPDTAEFWDGSTGSTSADGESTASKVMEGSLPKSILFDPSQGGGGDSANGWTKVAVFLPDGTCANDAKVTVKADDSSPLIISVRGLTGIVSVRTRKQEEGK